MSNAPDLRQMVGLAVVALRADPSIARAEHLSVESAMRALACKDDVVNIVEILLRLDAEFREVAFPRRRWWQRRRRALPIPHGSYTHHLGAAYKAAFFAIRALQDALYCALLEQPGKPARAGSMSKALTSEKNPVRPVLAAQGGRLRLVAGAGRIATAKKMGIEQLWCLVLPQEADTPHARLAFIDENLVRVELTDAERDQMWVARRSLLEQLDPSRKPEARKQEGRERGGPQGGRGKKKPRPENRDKVSDSETQYLSAAAPGYLEWFKTFKATRDEIKWGRPQGALWSSAGNVEIVVNVVSAEGMKPDRTIGLKDMLDALSWSLLLCAVVEHAGRGTGAVPPVTQDEPDDGPSVDS